MREHARWIALVWALGMGASAACQPADEPTAETYDEAALRACAAAGAAAVPADAAAVTPEHENPADACENQAAHAAVAAYIDAMMADVGAEDE